MKYDQFEQTPAWKDSEALGARILKLTEHRYFRSHRGFRDQLERAAVSVSNNIAEGFEQGTTAALIKYLYIARGSAGEVRSMLRLLLRTLESLAADADRPPPDDRSQPTTLQASNRRPDHSSAKSQISTFKFQISILKSEIQPLPYPTSELRAEAAALIPLCDPIARQLRGWADHLQNSNIKGQRDLTDATREEHARQVRAAAFIEHLNSLNPHVRKDE